MELHFGPENEDPATVHDVANNFFRSTTIHGYGRIYRQRSWHRRLLWSCLCIGLTIWALYHILVIIADYYHYPTKINREEKEKKVEEFPAITVCNLNPLGSPSSLVNHPIWGSFKDMDDRASVPVCDEFKETKPSSQAGTAAMLSMKPRDSKKSHALEMRKNWLASLDENKDTAMEKGSRHLIPTLFLTGNLPVRSQYEINGSTSRRKRNNGTEPTDPGTKAKMVENPSCFDIVTGTWTCFKCKDGTNISIELRCDGREHCPSGEDERNCTKCAEWAFLCDSGECIHSDNECDSNADCPGAEDETTCFVCNDGSLIRPYWTCNGVADCPDGEDEIICSEESEDCPFGYYRCSDDSCIKEQLLCDGEYDCPRHLDEFNCDTCQEGAFRCSSGECIAKHFVCDGQTHCYGGDDEANCTVIEKKCPEEYFRCDSGCFNPRFRCDHINHCLHGEDEKDCDGLVTSGALHELRMERSLYYKNLVSLVANTTERAISHEYSAVSNATYEETASYSPLCHTGVFCDHYGCYDSQLKNSNLPFSQDTSNISPPRLLCSMCGGSKPVCWARHWLNEYRAGSLSGTTLKMMMLKQKPNFLDLEQLYEPSHPDREHYSLSPEDFVFSCTFDKNYCDHTSFYSWASDHYGRCYTFNSPSVENATTVNPWPRMITQAGPKNSLRLTLNIESGISLLSPEVGVRVIIHSPHLLPVPEEEGFNLGPGSSSISVSRTMFERLGLPHGTCNDDYTFGSKMPFKYSRKLCNELCFEREIRKRCECRSGVSPAFNALDDGPTYYCNRKQPGDKICMDMVSRDYLGGYLDCGCREACREMRYHTQVTSSKINPQYYTNLHRDRKAVKALCSNDMEMVNLEIYLESMSYEVISESPTYTWDLLLSNVGGFMGLFIGMSFVTILELLELVVDLLIVVFKRRSLLENNDEENQKKKPVLNNTLRPGISTSWAKESDDERRNGELNNDSSVVLKKTLEVLLMEQHDINKELNALKLEQEAMKQQLGTVYPEEKTRC
ncbi:uncharacterized protein LOC135221243 [Macrobrachium nipponense]|uniref:uncharacterized protein LOC135221243 n=1 Tax=Macrobrachium nipponense TaxID=159736 RepID=UPI0030C7CB92